MNIQAPDGKIISFPDSMGQGEIEAELAKLYPAQAPPPAPEVRSAPDQQSGWTRPLALGASELVKGAVSTLGLPGDLQRLAEGGYNALGARIGLDPLPSPEGQSIGQRILSGTLPTSNELLDLSGRAGLTQRADLIPSGPGEKLLAGAASGTGAALPLLPFGGGVGKTLLQGAAGGTAGELAHQAAPGSVAGPIVAGALAGAGVQGVTNLLAGDPFKRTAAALGSAQTPQEAGVNLQELAREWKTQTMPVKEAAVWGPVDAAIPAATSTPLPALTGVLAQMSAKGGTLQPVLDQIASDLPKRMSTALQATGMLSGTPSWADVRSLRSSIGDMMRNPKLAQDMSSDDLDNIYKAVTQDLGATAKMQGAGDLFDSANAESTRLHGFEKNVLGSIITGTNPAQETLRPEDVATRLLSRSKRGASDLEALRGEIPQAVDELAAAHLNYNPGGWKNLAPEAKAALVEDPEARSALDSASIKAPGKLVTGLQHLTGMQLGDLVGMAAGHLLGDAPGSELYGGALGGMVGMIAPNLGQASRALIRPNMLGAEALGGASGRAGGLPPTPSPP